MFSVIISYRERKINTERKIYKIFCRAIRRDLMSFAERIKKIISDCRERGENMPESTFGYDMNQYAEHRYEELEYPERLARSMADAIRNQKIYIYPEDRIIGRIYHLNEKRSNLPAFASRFR